MKRFIKRIEWIFDYYVAYILYSPMKFHRYHEYMISKWGEKYKKTLEP